ncbi:MULTISPECIES: hypothetical protein [Clostridia]|nr:MULTISPECIES: hypothetical protein [Clostridia]
MHKQRIPGIANGIYGGGPAVYGGETAVSVGRSAHINAERIRET